MESNVNRFLAGVDQREFNAYCDAHYADWLHHLHLLPGCEELLTEAQHRYAGRIAIVTNCPRHITGIILSHLQLTHYFHYIVCAGDEVRAASLPASLSSAADTYELRPKPETDILVYCAHLMGVEPCDTVFLGDSRYDMEAGKKAGCLCVGVGIATGDIFCADTRAAVALFEQ
jgi:phosphoglycolate phosphatase-like HAD superfamily hydrolase